MVICLTLNKECYRMNKFQAFFFFLLLLINAQANLFATKLHKACQNGKIEKVKKLTLESNLDVNEQDTNSNTPLHIAVTNGHINIVEYLLTLEEIDLEIRNNNGDTAFDIACIYGHMAIAKYIYNKMGKTNIELFHEACEKEKFATTILLKEQFSFDVNKEESSEETPISNQEDIILYLKEAPREYNSPTLQQTSETTTNKKHKKKKAKKISLYQACQNGNLKQVIFCTQKSGNKVCQQDPHGNTPLHIATQEGHLLIMKHLLALKETDLTVLAMINSSGDTAFDLACKNEHPKIAKRILYEMASLTTRLSFPLHLATEKVKQEIFFTAYQKKKIEILAYLQQNLKLTINVRNQEGDSLLHIACRNGDLKKVKSLVEKEHAYIEAHNHQWQTPLDITCESEHKNVTQYMYDKLVKSGKLPLHDACERGNLTTVTYLVEILNCSLTEINNNKKTPLDIACNNEHPDIAEYICQKIRENKILPLHNACERERVLITVQYLVETLKHSLTKKNSNNETPLDVACRCNKKITAQCIYDIRLNRDKKLSLHGACTRGNLTTVTYLVEQLNCSLTKTNSKKETPLDVAREYKQEKIVTYLLQREKGDPSKNQGKQTTCNSSNSKKSNTQSNDKKPTLKTKISQENLENFKLFSQFCTYMKTLPKEKIKAIDSVAQEKKSDFASFLKKVVPQSEKKAAIAQCAFCKKLFEENGIPIAKTPGQGAFHLECLGTANIQPTNCIIEPYKKTNKTKIIF